jgi:hypothetical protein
MDTEQGVIELYGVLFFELEKKMMLSNKLNKNEMLVLRGYLSDMIKDIDQIADKKINSWKSHIRPLCIR